MSPFIIFLKRHRKVISYFVFLSPINLQEDIKQELEMLLFLLYKNGLQDNIINKEDYIFRSLKNKTIEIIKKNKILLYGDYEIREEEIADLDSLAYINSIYAKDIYSLAKIILTNKEFEIMACYYFEEKSKTEVARSLHISQQYVSRVIAKSIRKLQLYFGLN